MYSAILLAAPEPHVVEEVGRATLVTTTAPTVDPVTAPIEDGDDADDADGATLSSFARCADGNGTLTHLFFSDDDVEIARAQAICRSCGLADACLAGAIEREEPAGVWGGKVLVDGRAVDVRPRRGRPPKTPRRPLIIDEVPLPPHLVA